MTEQEAYHAVGLLIGGIKMWPEAATDGFVATFVKHCDDAPAMIETCERISMSWGDRSGRPGVGEVMDEYRKHPRVAAERENRTNAALARGAGSPRHCNGNRWVQTANGYRPCPRCNPEMSANFGDTDQWERWLNGAPLPPGAAGETLPPACKLETFHEDPHDRTVGFAEGRAIIADAYRSAYGRELGTGPKPDPNFAETLIRGDDRYDAKRDAWHSTYSSVVEGFRSDHARAQASLRALGRRLTHDNLGNLTLGPEEELPPHLPAVEAPADRPPDPSGLLTEALGITRSRMENRDG